MFALQLAHAMKAPSTTLLATVGIVAFAMCCLLVAALFIGKVGFYLANELVEARGLGELPSVTFWLFFVAAVPVAAVPCMNIFLRLTEGVAKDHEAAAAAKEAATAERHRSQRRRKKTD